MGKMDGQEEVSVRNSLAQDGVGEAPGGGHPWNNKAGDDPGGPPTKVKKVKKEMHRPRESIPPSVDFLAASPYTW